MPYIGFIGGDGPPTLLKPQMPTLIRNNDNKVYISLVEDRAFMSAIQGLYAFTLDNNADCDMAYDWVCDQADCHSFVNDNPAWDMFYDTWQSAAEEAGLDEAIIAGDSRY